MPSSSAARVCTPPERSRAWRISSSRSRPTEGMKSYRVPLADFEPDFGCGGRARYPEDMLAQLVGFEVVDIAVQNKPTRFSVGSISLHQ